MSAWLRLRVDARREEARPVPVRFGLHGDEHEVEEVLDHWPGQGHHYVKVRTRAGDLYILRHDEERDAWEVSFFREEEGGGPGLDPRRLEDVLRAIRRRPGDRDESREDRRP